LGQAIVRRPGVRALRISPRIGCELAAAAGRAEEVSVAVMRVTMRAVFGINLHPAHRIDGGSAGGVRMNRMCHDPNLIAEPLETGTR
jgi:hypothetical protein